MALLDLGARALINEGPTCTGARSPGFYCRNQSGKNPNLTVEEFADLLEIIGQQGLLVDSDDLTLVIDVVTAVCNTRQQLERQIAVLVLNLAANLIDEATPLVNGTMVGQALDEALRVANDPDATKQERNEIKNVLDAINNNVNTVLGDECVSEENGGVELPSPAPPQTPPPGKLTICHKGKKTLSISADAWSAHQAHGDTMGPCVP